MKTMRTNSHAMRFWTDLALLFALAMLLAAVAGVFDPAEARADVRVRVKGRIQTPVGDVYVDAGNHRHVPRYHERRVHRPVLVRDVRPPVIRHCDTHAVSRHDLEVAWRLSYLSGIGEARLLHLRERGWSWKQIGREFGLPRAMVRAAQNERRFERLVAHRRAHHGGVVWIGHGGGGWGGCCD